MRIVFLTPEYVTEKNFDGGLANYLGRVCPSLAVMGHEVVVVVASDKDGTLVQDGIEVHRVAISPVLPLWLNRFTLWRLPSAILWLVQSWRLKKTCGRLHKERPFDLIQHTSYTATGVFRLGNVPEVVRISSYEPLLQKAYDFPVNLDSRLKCWLDKFAIRRADGVFGPSKLIAEAVTKDVGRPVDVIESPFTVDRAEWDERPYRDLLDGKQYLLFFGTLGVLKGVPTIAEIIGPLLQGHPDLRFVFVGKDVGYRGRPAIEHVWEKAGPCRGRVLYLGPMRHGQLYPIVGHATAVVLPSRIDNLPNTCLEAMAFERVVIGTRGASFEQLLEDGRSGFLCPPEAPGALLGVIEQVLALPEEEKADIGRAAARRVEALEPDITIARLLDFYRNVISR